MEVSEKTTGSDTIPPADTPPVWNVYRDERSELLKRIVERLTDDRRVAAAWLFGSLGRGDADQLSDIDVWVVVEDKHIGAFVAQPAASTELGGPPLFVVEAPQNAPRGGAYLMACYDAPIAPHLVDWYWQPLSEAAVPLEARTLFDWAGLPHSDEKTPPGQGTSPNRSPTDAANQAIRFFWAMLMIAAKHAARHPFDTEMTLAPYALGPLREVAKFVGNNGVRLDLPAHASPEDKLAVLRLLADRMATLLPEAAAREALIPQAAELGARRFLDLIAPRLTTIHPE